MWYTKSLRIWKGDESNLNHTALSATHMVDISLRDPGGGEMVKVRLQGTKEDMEWLEKQLKECPEIQITESSEPFSNKGTNKYYRKYLEINKNKVK